MFYLIFIIFFFFFFILLIYYPLILLIMEIFQSYLLIKRNNLVSPFKNDYNQNIYHKNNKVYFNE